MPIHRTARVLILLLALTGFAAPGSAAPWTTDGLDDYWITRWDRSAGAPGELVVAMVQDRDGYLWLGSADGLTRFDGFMFQRWADISTDALAGGSVRSLFVDQAGRLWVGFDEGGVSSITGSTVRNYGRQDGLPAASIRTFTQDSTGTIWIGSLDGLFQLAGDRVTQLPAGRGLPPGPVLTTLVDATGSFYVGTPQAIYRRRTGGQAFEALTTHAPSGNSQSLCKDADGHIVVTDPARGFRVIEGGDAHPLPSTAGYGFKVSCARNGTLWVGTRLTGLWRVGGTGQRAEPVAVRTGLLGQAALTVLEDRDQNIWVTTSNGVYRLTPGRVRTLPEATVPTTVTADRAGRMWVGTVDGLSKFERGDLGWRRAGTYLAGTQIRSVHADPAGTLWIATADGVMRVSGSLPVMPPWGGTLRQVTSITSNAAGTLWLYDEAQGLHRLRDQQLERLELAQDLRGRASTVLHADRRNRLWLVSDAGIEIRGDDGDVRRYTAADGLADAEYRSIYEDRDGAIWLGSAAGLSRMIDGRIETIAIAGVRRSVWVKTIVEDSQGQLWLGVEGGGIRLSRASFQNALRTPSRVLTDGYEVFDGLPGTIRSVSDRVAARASDGQLWFTTDEGIGIVDPATNLPNRGVVPARIASVAADGVRLGPAQQAELKAGTRQLEVSWAALDLTTPDRVRFRYRLDGLDREWIDGGQRQQVAYAALPPGNYVFRVAAAREGDTWSENSGASWEFTIAPPFYRAIWFPFAIAGLVAAASWASWHLRMVQVRRRFAITLRERARVSREVHDTLLQSLVGVALQCQTLAHSTDGQVRERLMTLRSRIDDHIGEARELIWNLRSPTLERHDLVTALHRAATAATEGTSVRVDFQTRGRRSRAAEPAVERELLRIGQEAIANAVRHGAPSLIGIQVQFDEDSIGLRVTDDGAGFALPETPGIENGHCGLAMMRERAEEIGGTVSITSASGRGTAVAATAPLTPARAV
jgi:signal transduction histidine kinase